MKLVKPIDGDIKYISDLLDMDESFTHWRPVNLK